MIDDNKKSFWTNKRITAIAAMIVAVATAVSVGANAVIHHNNNNSPVANANINGGNLICTDNNGNCTGSHVSAKANAGH